MNRRDFFRVMSKVAAALAVAPHANLLRQLTLAAPYVRLQEAVLTKEAVAR